MMKDGVAQANEAISQMAGDAQKAQHLIANGRVGIATIAGGLTSLIIA